MEGRSRWWRERTSKWNPKVVEERFTWMSPYVLIPFGGGHALHLIRVRTTVDLLDVSLSFNGTRETCPHCYRFNFKWFPWRNRIDLVCRVGGCIIARLFKQMPSGSTMSFLSSPVDELSSMIIWRETRSRHTTGVMSCCGAGGDGILIPAWASQSEWWHSNECRQICLSLIHGQMVKESAGQKSVEQKLGGDYISIQYIWNRERREKARVFDRLMRDRRHMDEFEREK